MIRPNRKLRSAAATVALFSILGLLTAVCAPNGSTSKPPEELRELLAVHESFEEATAAKVSEQLADLDEKFRAALSRGMEQSGARGDVDAVFAFRNSLEALSTASAQPEGGGVESSAFEEIVRMQAIHQEEGDKLRAALQEKRSQWHAELIARLETMATELAKDGKLDEAIEVRQARERLRDELGVSLLAAGAHRAPQKAAPGRLRVVGQFENGVTAIPEDLQTYPEDFVSVGAFRWGWAATRTDGSGVIYVANRNDATFHINASASPSLIAKGYDFWYVNDNRNYTQVNSGNWWDLQIGDPVIMAGADAVAIMIDAEGKFDVRGGGDKAIPYQSLIESATDIVATRHAFFRGFAVSCGKGGVWRLRRA